MRLPIAWLKEYIGVTLTPEKLADALTLSGSKVESVGEHGGDTVIHIEVTTNRPDCLSIWGLAREVSAITGKKASFPAIGKTKPSNEKPAIKIAVADKAGCPRYTARVIRNVTVKAAPVQAQACVDAAGARAINNIVDATNFVLFETGQPLHAFDLDRLKGGTLTVRRAKKGEKFLAIDGVEHTLGDDALVIADAEGPVAMAGVMGGKRTEVTATTKNILLESAYFDPALVRRASKKYKINSESSYRFERGVNPALVETASLRARDLILEWAGGVEAGPAADIRSSRKEQTKTIAVSATRISGMLGMTVGQPRIISILKSLGLDAKRSGRDGVAVRPDSGRRDIALEADIAEEVLRIEGFDKVKPAIPLTRHSGTVAADPKPALILELKKFLAAQGFSEIMSFSLISEKALRDSGFTEFSLAQKIRNPLSAAQEYLRPSLLPGMLETILYNVHRKAETLRLFEIGNRYLAGEEQTVLTLALTGSAEENWLRKNAAVFTDIKGAAENVLSFFKIKNFIWSAKSGDATYGVSSVAAADGRILAKAGEIAPAALTRWGLQKSVFAAEVLLDEALAIYRKAETPKAARPPRFPIVRRDIAFVVEESVPAGTLEAAMREAAGPALTGAQLFDEFKGKSISAGKRSLAFALSFRKDDGTFTDAEIQSLYARVSDTLRQKFKAEIRA